MFQVSGVGVPGSGSSKSKGPEMEECLLGSGASQGAWAAGAAWGRGRAVDKVRQVKAANGVRSSV